MSEWFISAFGGVADDIRQKLIDEAWFGRRPQSPDRGTEPQHTPEPERDPQSPNPWEMDRGIDR